MAFKAPTPAPDEGPAIVRYEDDQGAVRYQLADGTPLPPMVEAMVASIWREIEVNEGAAALGIAGNILDADNLDEVAALSGEAFSLRDLVGHRLHVRSVKWARGDKPGGFGVFAIVDTHDETNQERRIVTTGAVNCVAFLFKADRSGWLPTTVEVRSSHTRSGFDALWLVPAPKPF